MTDFFRWWDKYTEEELALGKKYADRALLFFGISLSFLIVEIIAHVYGKEFLYQWTTLGWGISVLLAWWNLCDGNKHIGNANGACLAMREFLDAYKKLNEKGTDAAAV